MIEQFQPTADESYLDSPVLGRRWNCHEKTAQRRAKRLGVATLMFANRTVYPMSEILRVEREALKNFVNRKTEFPAQFIGKNSRGKARAYRKGVAAKHEFAAK
jgi:hypothetical protein